MNRKIVIPFGLTLLAAGMALNSGNAYADSVNVTPYLSFGADLKQSEKQKVYDLLGVSESDLSDYKVVTVTNSEEHQYLDDYLSSSVIGSRALSSVKITKADSGSGISVKTQNISYCTAGMYENALSTAGVEDANVTVAGPFEISGTSALVGVMKAYEDMTGTSISSESKDTATNELVVTGELAEAIGDSDKAEQFIAYVKEKVSEADDISSEEMQDIIDEGCKTYNISLTDEQEQQLKELLEKIDDLDLNVEDLKEQAKSIYNELKNSGIDTEEVKNIFQQIIDFLTGLFSDLLG